LHDFKSAEVEPRIPLVTGKRSSWEQTNTSESEALRVESEQTEVVDPWKLSAVKLNHWDRFPRAKFCVQGKGDPDKDFYLINAGKKEAGELLVLGCRSGFLGRIFCGFLYALGGFFHCLTSFLHGFVYFFSSPLRRAFSSLFLACGQTEPQQHSGNHKTAFFVDRHYFSPFVLFMPDC
jgi:hypothetical protein